MLTGTENTLAAALKTDLEARILAALGSPVATPNHIKELTDAIAFQTIPHFLASVQILPGSFTAPVGGGPVTGVGVFL